MTISYTVYEKSALATVCSIAGTLCFSIGLCGVIASLFARDFSWFTVCLALVGAGLMVVAGKINRAVVRRKIRKAFCDEALIETVRTSTVAAYALYKNLPNTDMNLFLREHNPVAAQYIAQYTRREISEEELIARLRLQDGVTQHEAAAQEKVLYKNAIFTLSPVKTTEETYREQTAAYNKRMRKNTWGLMISGSLTAAALIVMAVTIGMKTEREIVPFSLCETGDYTAIEAVVLEPERLTEDYRYFYFETASGDYGTVRLSLTDGADKAVTALCGKATSQAVTLYGVLREEQSVVYFNTTPITLQTDVMYATLEPEMQWLGITTLALGVLCIAGAVVFMLFINRYCYKDEHMKAAQDMARLLEIEQPLCDGTP